jgi:hypothetical protein
MAKFSENICPFAIILTVRKQIIYNIISEILKLMKSNEKVRK